MSALASRIAVAGPYYEDLERGQRFDSFEHSGERIGDRE